MFDIGFWELLILGVIALLVVGPERLPALATHAGRWIARIRLKARRIQAQIRDELEHEHLKTLVSDRDRELSSLRQEVEQVRREVDHAARTERWSGLAGPHSHPEPEPAPGPGDAEPESGADDRGAAPERARDRPGG